MFRSGWRHPSSGVRTPRCRSRSRFAGTRDELPEAHPGSRRGSALGSLARAHATVRIAAGCELLAAGEIVDAELLPAPLAMREGWAGPDAR